MTPELFAKIRRLYFGEHWKVGTIATELGIHKDTVRRGIEADRFVVRGAVVRPSLLDPYKAIIQSTLEKHPRLRATRLFEMIAKNIAHRAVLAGHSVAFFTASELLLDLQKRDSARSLELRLKHLEKIGLLVVDELGYLAYDDRAADLLFQIVNRRYEKKSLLITTNLAFSDWPTIFPNATSATALIDRVIHYADIASVAGESYRKREAQLHQKKRAAARKALSDNKSARKPQK